MIPKGFIRTIVKFHKASELPTRIAVELLIRRALTGKVGQIAEEKDIRNFAEAIDFFYQEINKES